MNRIIGRLAAIAALAGAAWAARPAAAEVNQELDAHFQATFIGSPKYTPQSKFEEYRQYPSGFVLDRYLLSYDKGDYEFSLHMRDLDQAVNAFNLGVDGGKPGVFSYNAYWDQTPHTFAYNAKTLYTLYDHGRLFMDPGLRNQNGVFLNAANKGAYVNNMIMALNPLEYTTLQMQTDKAAVNLAYNPAKDLTVKVGASRLHKEGVRQLGQGFGFGTSGPQVDIPQPVDNTTNEAYLGVELAKKEYNAAFKYEVSAFHNDFTNLAYDNPQYSPALNTAAHPAMGQVALDPNNIAHTFTLSGGAELPFKTRFSAEASVAYWMQNDDLLPYTINPAVIAGGSDPRTLPAKSAGQKMIIYTQQYRLANSALKDFRTSLTYRSYELESHNQTITFPYYVSRDIATTVGPAQTEHERSRDVTAEWKGDYDLTEKATLNLGYGYTYKSEPRREIPQSYEQSFEGGVNMKPTPELFVNASYLLGLRRMKDFNQQANFNLLKTNWADIPGLVRWDVGDRNRNQARLQASYAKGESSYGASYRVTYDDFRPGTWPLDGGGYNTIGNFGSQYGLLHQHTHAVGFDVSQALSPDFSTDFYYEYDFQTLYLKDRRPAAAGNQNTSQVDWVQREVEQSNIGGVALNYNPSKDLKLTASYDLTWTFGHSDFLDGGNAGATVNSTTGSTLTSLPRTKSMRQTIGLKGKYQINKDVALKGGWIFQKYELNDFAVNNLAMVPADGRFVSMGNSQGSWSANVFSLGVEAKF